MKILFCNDDGAHAEGIRILAAAFDGEYDRYLAAPDSERSAASRSMTLSSPLRARKVDIPGIPEMPAYAINGTPVDCVRLAIGNLVPEPDVVVSGINHGANLGTDVLYSGTVAAAHEAALLGYQAIAVSSCARAPEHFASAARAARWAVDYVAKNPLPFGTVLNVNVPDLPLEQIRGIRAVPTCMISYALAFIPGKDPSGAPYYWPPSEIRAVTPRENADECVVREGYIAVTPLTYDLTDHRTLKNMNFDTIQF